MHITLDRFAYTATETQGGLIVRDEVFYTLERPWVKGAHIGGQSFQSCIPDGEYDLRPFTRANGDSVFSLSNPDLGVWVNEDDRPDDWGRYAILIHVGNKVNDVVGCIAPGEARTIYENQVFVTSSRATMNRVRNVLNGAGGPHKILIRPALGASD